MERGLAIISVGDKMENGKGQYVTQKCFNDLSKNTTELIDVLNHRMSKFEIDLKWIKRIGYYMATLMTAIVIKFLVFN